MAEFESLLLLLLAAALLAAAARRLGVPYPAFLALGGVVLAFLPHAPAFELEPELALALFVAPVLLDAAYDASPRDLRSNWIPLASLVVGAVCVTIVAVAWVVHAIVPAMPWAAAVALGAVVAPPDAAAAIAVLRQVRPPHRILTILEGESLLNDATALLVYRLAVGAVVAHGFVFGDVAPTFTLAVAGSLLAGPAIARAFLWLTSSIRDVPTAIILQFVSTFGVWILAERLGLSAVLTMVCYAVAVARRAPASVPAEMRVPSYAVWETAVFVLNVLAFVLIGLQIRPILESLEPSVRMQYFAVSVAVLVAVIVVRIVWVMGVVALMRWAARGRAPRPGRMPPPTLAGGFVVSWCGMRGIVTLAAALAIPTQAADGPFPYRDLIVLSAFCVVLGTLVIQGLSLKALLRRLSLPDDDPVGREVAMARARALRAAIAGLERDRSPAAVALREQFQERIEGTGPGRREATVPTPHDRLRRDAVATARQVVLGMRDRAEIGDDAFHVIEEELDRLDMSGPVGGS